MEYQCTRERFLEEVKDHKMIISRDEGVNRRIVFKQPESNYYRFELITWPGYLCVTGDMGEWMFSRITDMFDFFIMDERDFNHKYIINPHYWSEKVMAAPKGNNSIEEFDEDLLKKRAIELIENYWKDDEDKKKECLEEFEEEVISPMIDNSSPELAYHNMYNFTFEKFQFDELPDANIYTHHYIWICYAIVWGIMEYKNSEVTDNEKETEI